MKINSRLKFICPVLSFLITALCGQSQQKRIYIANDDHTDYLWDADENTYRNAFVNMLDFYIRKADSTINNGFSSDQQSRFNCDGNFWLWTYEQNKTPTEVNALVNKLNHHLLRRWVGRIGRSPLKNQKNDIVLR